MKETTKVYECEACGRSVIRLNHGGEYETTCEWCGSTAYRDPFPASQVMKRLDALIKRLEKEDGPITALPV